jgi:hypothetical protein
MSCNALFFYYKKAILKLVCIKIIKYHSQYTPNSLSVLANRRECNYSLRANHQLSAPRFNTRTRKKSCSSIQSEGQYTLSVITSQLHCSFQLRTTLNGKDFNFFLMGCALREAEQFLLQHMHKKEFFILTMQ